MPSPDIPQEIIDCIIEELRHNTRALIACSIVSRSFFPSSRRLLFSTLYLDCSKRSAVLCERLKKTLEFNPDLAILVENLFFRLKGEIYSGHTQAFPLTFGLLSHLRSLTMSCHSPWSEIPRHLQVALGAILRLPLLASATITDIRYFPVSLFTQSIQLKRLSMRDITISPSDRLGTESLDPPLRKGQLEFLSGGEGESDATATQLLVNFLAQRSSQLGISQLRHFTAAVWSNEGVQAYQTMFNSAAKSLESLTLSAGYPASSPALDALSLGPLRRLQRLSVSIFEHPKSPRWLLHLIASASEHHLIEEITINTFSVDFGDTAWGELDTLLSQTKFTSLRSITLRYWRQDSQVLLPEMQFPCLLTQNNFTVYHECDRVFPRIPH